MCMTYNYLAQKQNRNFNRMLLTDDRQNKMHILISVSSLSGTEHLVYTNTKRGKISFFDKFCFFFLVEFVYLVSAF